MNDFPMMHYDVMDTVVSHYIDRYNNGEKLTESEIMEFTFLRNMMFYQEYSELAKDYKSLHGKYADMLHTVLDRQDSIKIYDLFLRNHGLEEQFDHFYTRILRRKFRDVVDKS